MNITRQMAMEVKRFVDEHDLVAFEVIDYNSVSDNCQMRIGVVDMYGENVITDFSGIPSSMMNKFKKILNIKKSGIVDVETLIDMGLIEYYGAFEVPNKSTAYNEEYEEYLTLGLINEMVTV